MTKKVWLAGMAIGLALAGCNKGSSSSQPAASGSAPAVSAPASAAASSSAAPAASGSAASAATADGKGLAGEYTAKKATIEPPEKVPDVTWKKDPGDKMVGPGKLDIKVADGMVSGQASGALGDQIVAGTFDGKELKFSLMPKDQQAPDALSCTGVGEAAAAGVTGTMRCNGNSGVIVREATFELKSK